MDKYEMIGYVFVALVAIAGGIGTLYKVISAMRDERSKENKEILKLAHEYVDLKINGVCKELEYQKEIHSGKTAELADKIEQLREDIQRHQNTLVELISKIITKDRL